MKLDMDINNTHSPTEAQSIVGHATQLWHKTRWHCTNVGKHGQHTQTGNALALLEGGLEVSQTAV